MQVINPTLTPTFVHPSSEADEMPAVPVPEISMPEAPVAKPDAEVWALDCPNPKPEARKKALTALNPRTLNRSTFNPKPQALNPEPQAPKPKLQIASIRSSGLERSLRPKTM